MALTNIIAKLSALNDSLTQTLVDPHRLHFRYDTYLDLFSRYASLSDALREKESVLFGDLPDRGLPPVSATDSGGNFFPRERLSILQNDIRYCLEILQHTAPVQLPSMAVTREGIFFAGEVFDAYRHVIDILSRARQSVLLIDGYIDDRVLNLLSTKNGEVHVSVLTKAVSPFLATIAQTFNTQYGKLEIRTSKAFHDRFVIVDDTDFYHFGASIKDAGTRGFMFSRIEEPTVINALRDQWKKEWQASTIVVTP